MYTYKTKGVCSTEISFDVQDGVVKDVKFKRGCTGNLQAIGKLVEGMTVEEVINRLKGIQCQNGTSCADQLAKALKQSLE